MVRILLATLLAFALGACQQVPQSGQAPVAMHSTAKLMQSAASGGSAPASGSPYGTAIVKDLAISGHEPTDLTRVDLANFKAMREELSAIFGATFRETLKREGYVRLALPDDSDADVVTIQPAAMRISSGYNLEIAVAVRDAGGRFLGWYAVQYSGESQDASSVSHPDALRRAFADAGEQVARAIAAAR